MSVGTAGSTYYIRIPQGAYFTNGGPGYPEITVSATDLGITADKIAAGQTIGGVVGTADSSAQIRDTILGGMQGGVITAPRDGAIYLRYNGNVSNHDNSGDRTFIFRIKIGTNVVKEGSCYVAPWGGGSIDISGVFDIKAGQSVSFESDPPTDHNATSIFWTMTTTSVFCPYK